MSQIDSGKNFFKIAKDNAITPRTLLAWRRHELDKWLNDPREGREPGPSADYLGDWPSEEEEMKEYLDMKIAPHQIEDKVFGDRYAKYLLDRNISI